jgi:hypothetical protein
VLYPCSAEFFGLKLLNYFCSFKLHYVCLPARRPRAPFSFSFTAFHSRGVISLSLLTFSLWHHGGGGATWAFSLYDHAALALPAQQQHHGATRALPICRSIRGGYYLGPSFFAVPVHMGGSYLGPSFFVVPVHMRSVIFVQPHSSRSSPSRPWRAPTVKGISVPPTFSLRCSTLGKATRPSAFRRFVHPRLPPLLRCKLFSRRGRATSGHITFSSRLGAHFSRLAVVRGSNVPRAPTLRSTTRRGAVHYYGDVLSNRLFTAAWSTKYCRVEHQLLPRGAPTTAAWSTNYCRQQHNFYIFIFLGHSYCSRPCAAH